jgi:hypothetical protein
VKAYRFDRPLVFLAEGFEAAVAVDLWASQKENGLAIVVGRGTKKMGLLMITFPKY